MDAVAPVDVKNNFYEDILDSIAPIETAPNKKATVKQPNPKNRGEEMRKTVLKPKVVIILI